MTAHELLVAARNGLERDGWSQGKAGSGMSPDFQIGGLCAWGALAHCTHEGRREGRPLLSAERALCRAAEVSDLDALFAWNDHPHRRKAEVLAVYDKAIAATAPLPDVSFVKVPDDVAVVIERHGQGTV